MALKKRLCHTKNQTGPKCVMIFRLCCHTMYKILSGHNNLFRIENFTDPVLSDGYWESKKEMSRKKKKSNRHLLHGVL